jgi:pSer/pThr/pTyr-binding forkhead associated (FHA) protein/S1-C subfamily serine protease
MPHLKLLDKGANKSHRVDSTEAVVGRDPAAAIFVEGDAAKTVSGRHARFFLDDGKWFVEDSGSRNGTFIGTRKLEPGARHALSVGEVVGLGLTGTQLVVEEVLGRAFAATMLEAPPDAPLASGTMPMRRSEAIRAGLHDLSGPQSTDEVRLTLRGVHSGARMVGQADRVTIGRALECLIRVEGESATSVSRVHTEVVASNGVATIRDGGSRHGTYVNGKKIAGPQPLKHGDLIMLGPGGPTFTVDEAIVVPAGTKAPAGAAVATSEQTTPTGSIPNRKDASAVTPVKQKSLRGREEAFVSESPTPAVARAAIKTSPKKPEPGPVTRLARASGVGRTALLRNVLEEVSVQSAKRIRVFVWAMVAVFAVITSAIVIYAKRHMDRTDAQLEVASVGFKQQAAALDSLRAAATNDAAIAKASLDSAMRAAAPKAVLDSLRGALADADRRSVGLEESLKRAKSSLDTQLSGADSMRRDAEQELSRLKVQVAAAQATGADSRAVLDSLHKSLKAADDRVKEVSGQVRALKGADFPQIAQLNQGAVGMVTMRVGQEYFDGSGFVISPSGYFLTNRHVVVPEGSTPKDTIFVTMSDHSAQYIAEVVMIAPKDEPDVALLRIKGYRGSVVAKIDWTGTHAIQGEAAALIGFPGGEANAVDKGHVVRSSMSAGTLSKVTPDLIQFSGLSVSGSSGSPLFNAAGEVIGLHRAGLREGPGLGYAVPLARVMPLLPENVRAELGLAAK